MLDRTKEPGSLGEPLYLDVAATLREAGLNDVVLTGGRYGLGSKDTPPSSIFALFKELEKDQPKERFTLGITDDVTFLSLPEVKPRSHHRSCWHQGVQVLGSGRRRYCRC